MDGLLNGTTRAATSTRSPITLPDRPRAEATQGPRGRLETALLCGLAALPLIVMGVGAWSAWRQAWRDAGLELERTAEAASEFAQRVLSAHAVAAGRADALTRGLTDAEIRDREQILHRELREVIAELPQAERLGVFDRVGRPLVAAVRYPVARDGFSIADRELFQALTAADAPRVHLGDLFIAHIDQALFFAVSRRRTRTGNPDVPPGGFDGVVVSGVDPNRIKEGLARLVMDPNDSLTLARADGAVLARNRDMQAPTRFRGDGHFAELAQAGAERGRYEIVSSVEGRGRLYAVRRIEGWPAYAVVGRARSAVSAAWRRAVAAQLRVGVPATLLLAGLVAMVLRGQARLREANQDLEQRVVARTLALQESEERFRTLAEHVPDVVYVQEAETGALEYLSPAYERIWGEPREAILRDVRRWQELLHPEDRRHLMALRYRLHAFGEPLAATYRILRPCDGAVRHIAHRAVPIRDATGQVRRIVGIAQDVTEHHAAEAALAASEAEFRAVFEGSVAGMVVTDPATGAFLRVNRRFCDITGHAEPELTGGMRLQDLAVPAERPGDGAALADPTGDDAERLWRRKDGTTIWIASHLAVVPAVDGRPARCVAVVQDVTERHAAEELRRLMTKELNHRAKNTLAVVQAALRLTPKDDVEAYARAVEGRVSALARAHTLLAQGLWTGAPLRAVLEAEAATFLPRETEAREATPPRVDVEGPEITLSPAAVQAVSMALHELATNATKYGALSQAGGSVAIAWSIDGPGNRLRLTWTERGGPPLRGAPARRGFGSRVIEATLQDQLGGRVTRHWEAGGLVCEIDLPLDRVTGRAEADATPAA